MSRNNLLIMLALLAGFSACTSPPKHSPTVNAKESPIISDLRIGLALGGGGANGLAHIAIFEAFDELGLRPYRIAGTSIGSIMGALYASGMSGQDIKELVDELVAQDSDSWHDLIVDRQLFRWLGLVDPVFENGGFISSEAFMDHLREKMEVETFEELVIPLSVVTADLWTREQVVLNAGPLYPAIQASMAVPGVFPMVELNGHHLVDGGLVNPVPYDLLLEDCDFVVAVNVIGKNIPHDDISSAKALYTSIRVMQTSIVREKLKRLQPDIFINTEIEGVRMLQFHKFDQVYEQAQDAKAELKSELRRKLQ